MARQSKYIPSKFGMTEDEKPANIKATLSFVGLGLFLFLIIIIGVSNSHQNSSEQNGSEIAKSSGFLADWNSTLEEQGLEDAKKLIWQQNKFTKVVDSQLPKEYSQEDETDYGFDQIKLDWNFFKIPGDQKVQLLLTTSYSGTSWIFGDAIYVRFGDESRSFQPEGTPYQNIITGGVFESMNFIFSEEDINYLAQVFETDNKEFQILITSNSSMGGMKVCNPNDKEVASMKLLLNTYRYLLNTDQLNLSFVDATN